LFRFIGTMTCGCGPTFMVIEAGHSYNSQAAWPMNSPTI